MLWVKPSQALIMHNLKAFLFGAMGISTLLWASTPTALAHDRLVQGPVQTVRFALDLGGRQVASGVLPLWQKGNRWDGVLSRWHDGKEGRTGYRLSLTQSGDGITFAHVQALFPLGSRVVRQGNVTTTTVYLQNGQIWQTVTLLPGGNGVSLSFSPYRLQLWELP